MAVDNLLTAEELDYIGTLLRRPEQAHATGGQSLSFKLEGSLPATSLLTDLASRASLTLEAHVEHFCLSFPVRLDEDEFHSQHLHLAPPIIYESGPHLRPWRLPLPKPLPLLEADGGLSGIRVRELSPSGLLADTAAKREAPEHFHLHLALPNGSNLPIDAHRVRRTENGLTAYAVDFTEERDAESLRHFLFVQHRRLHPELQTELPGDLV